MYIYGVMQVNLQIPKVILYVGNFVNKSFNILSNVSFMRKKTDDC